MSDAPHLRRGRWAEEQAARYLESRGLRLVARNFRCRTGEIDLVMTDGPMLVFVEVRFRRSDRYGSGAESVTWTKQRRLIAAARVYLARHALADAPCRFDVVSVSKRHYRPDFLWLRNAFGEN
ncbi:MAG TPA: YraN family protein [Pseudomonadales bacterium]